MIWSSINHYLCGYWGIHCVYWKFGMWHKPPLFFPWYWMLVNRKLRLLLIKTNIMHGGLVVYITILQNTFPISKMNFTLTSLDDHQIVSCYITLANRIYNCRLACMFKDGNSSLHGSVSYVGRDIIWHLSSHKQSKVPHITVSQVYHTTHAHWLFQEDHNTYFTSVGYDRNLA